jgi:putative heme-binding domain-containing protein
LIESLSRLPLSVEPDAKVVDRLRAYELCFTRMGRPSADTSAVIVQRLDAIFPSTSPRINRELCQLLAYLQPANCITKTLAMLTSSSASREEQLMYATALRTVASGWTIDQRRAFFQWLNSAETNLAGGFNVGIFLKQIRSDSVATLNAPEKQSLGHLIDAPAESMAQQKPRPFVKHWKYEELAPLLERHQAGRSFANGRAAFESLSCVKCHKFGMAGSNAAPMLLSVGSRFSSAELLESIMLPSRVISDQYAATDFVLKDKTVVNGRIREENATAVVVQPSLLSSATVIVKKEDVVKRSLSPISPMPEGLLDTLSADDILDVLAYLRSAGNPADDAFRK